MCSLVKSLLHKNAMHYGTQFVPYGHLVTFSCGYNHFNVTFFYVCRRSTGTGPIQPEVKALSISATDDKVKGLLAEFYNSRDVKEAILCVKELSGLNANLQYVVESTLTISLESKGTSWEHLSQLLRQLK